MTTDTEQSRFPKAYLMCRLVERDGENVSVQVTTFDDSRKPYEELIHTAATYFANVDGRDCIEVVPSLGLKGWVVTFPTMIGGKARGAGVELPVPESDVLYTT